jgi:LMBR1 domain-containing protein 1
MPPHGMRHVSPPTIKSVVTTTAPTRSSTKMVQPPPLSATTEAHHHIFHFSLLLIIACLSLVFALLTVRHFLSPSAKQLHVVIASAVALFIGFTTVLMPSVDVYVTSSHVVNSNVLHNMYLILFSITGMWLSASLPFSFFYAKSNPSLPFHHNICNSIQSTGIFLIGIVILLLAGLVFRPGHETWSSEPLTQSWMNNVFDSKHRGTAAILFLTGAFASVGCSGFILYTAYGMATLPLDLIRGYKDPEVERLEVETKLIQIKSRLRKLDKTGKSGDNAASIIKLKHASEIKRQHIRALDQLSDGGGTNLVSCCRLVGSCRIITGSLLLIVTGILTSALILSASDPGLEDASGCGGRSSTSSVGSVSSPASSAGGVTGGIKNVVKLVCQAETGYLGTLLNKPQLYNPFDELLVSLSSSFPLDLIVLSAALAFMFFASLYGVLRLGLRCCVCLSVYRFKRRGTSSSAILILGAVVMFISLSLLVQVPALAPKYATFGQQTVGGTVHCSLSDEAISELHSSGSGVKNEHCTMSQVAVLLVTLAKEFPMYSHIFYVTSWLHAIVVGLSLLYRGFCGGKASNFTDNDFHSISDNNAEDSDVELSSSKQGLLSVDNTEESSWDSGRNKINRSSSSSRFASVLSGRYGSEY